jgi:5-methylcytosine-specific restriction enzyme subunit McrC
MTDWYLLKEQQNSEGLQLSPDQLRDIRRALPNLTVEPGDEEGSYHLNPASYVGVIQLPTIGIRIVPKLPMQRVLFLWSYAFDPAHWRDRDVELPQAEDLISALAHVFAMELDAQMRGGLLEGYRGCAENSRTVRGRINFAEQWANELRWRPEVAVAYEEFTVDIVENRVLKAAIRALRRLPMIDRETIPALARCEQELADISPAHFSRGRIPDFHYHRGNQRFRRALELARLILSGTSFDLPGDEQRSINVRGLLFDMNKVFEEFVRAALRDCLNEQAARFGSVDEVQLARALYLDVQHSVPIKPDLLWVRHDITRFVGDVKYKRVGLPSMPNADVYQMLGYLIGTGLSTGMLVYPLSEIAESPNRGRKMEITVNDKIFAILVETLDTNGAPTLILQEVFRLARTIERIANEGSDAGERGPNCSGGSVR